MTETTIPAADATTDKQPSKLYTYWWSDDSVPCKAIYTLVPFDTVAYPLVDEAPDFTQLKNPKYNRVLHKWVEMDPESQGQQLAALQQTVTAQAQTMDAIKETQSTDSAATTKTLEAIQKSQEQQAATSAQMLKLLAPLIAPKPAAATDKGGAE